MKCISLTAANSTSRSSPTWLHALLWMTSSGQPPLGRGPERLQHTVHRQAGDLMVVANVGDSRVVLGTASDDDAITPFNSSST
jgi:serine/threonine protein phosphatase PrpC